MNMITTYAPAALINAAKDMSGACRFDFNGIMGGRIPDSLLFSGRLWDRWGLDNGQEIGELIAQDVNLCTEGEEVTTGDAMIYTAQQLERLIRGLTGWDSVHLHELMGPAWGTVNGLYLFTCPVSNTTWRTYGVWADSEHEAIEEMTEQLTAWATEDDMTDDEIAHEIELVLSSHVYAVVAH